MSQVVMSYTSLVTTSATQIKLFKYFFLPSLANQIRDEDDDEQNKK